MFAQPQANISPTHQAFAKNALPTVQLATAKVMDIISRLANAVDACPLTPQQVIKFRFTMLQLTTAGDGTNSEQVTFGRTILLQERTHDPIPTRAITLILNGNKCPQIYATTRRGAGFGNGTVTNSKE